MESQQLQQMNLFVEHYLYEQYSYDKYLSTTPSRLVTILMYMPYLLCLDRGGRQQKDAPRVTHT